MSAVAQSLGSGIPTAVCCPCICCFNWATSSSVQQSCRKTAARLRRRGLSDREKRSMHCTMAALVISERDEGEMRFIKVVMADRTVSSLWLDRQFVTKLIPLLCKMMSWHSGSILRLHSPPGRNTQHNMTVYQWWSDEMQRLLPVYGKGCVPSPNSTKFSFSSVSMSRKRSVTWSSFRCSMFFGSYAKLARLASTCSFASDKRNNPTSARVFSSYLNLTSKFAKPEHILLIDSLRN